ncbi:BZ3500_MvSof-1268-A1-R1_Chr3-1g05949 [Microbotryum saponariae]|uniref:BZ3500_MvSof-1268-A1-R1_Chr3-1g05949 protein n=1 Tax=Microbotryum saponariae TaxID=289078 RepID=A0A2X0LH74_9BASI|nr:BZ3500_MvSof-1268-A1-R1_Chr3-1g05949 [Microbotryum saponariae]SDA05139.1 BZ3501_MvSof-1269-A2-R1_Chr3-1g05619 [Microbotryum saponariae]
MSAPSVDLVFPEGHHIPKVSFSTGLFINNKHVPGVEGRTIDVINPATDKKVGVVAEATAADIDIAVEAAQKAFDTVWGEKTPGHERGKMLIALAEAIEEHADTIASIESLDNGKAYVYARHFDVSEAAACLRYYGGWADKNHGKVFEVMDSKMAYTRHEPLGVVGQIIPWNFPILMFAWKLGPALATGNTIVIKVAETTPLSAFYVSTLIAKIFPPGVVNIVTGYGAIAGAAISSHMAIEKVAFTGSTLVGRTIMKAAATSNLKSVTLELGGKSPNIIFDDADFDQAVSWSTFGLFFNHGQACCAGSRIFVQEGIYDKFLEALTAKVKTIKVGSPFAADTFQGPQTSQLQYDRIQAHIQSGKDEGATVHIGGERHGTEGYFIQPTIFTDVKPDMKIVKEEIFGPVVVVAKFKDEADVIAQANDTMYGLAAAVFSRDISRAIKTANAVKAGTVWVNCYNQLHSSVPFGGFKQSGIGRELGEYALANYTAVKAVHINLTQPSPM